MKRFLTLLFATLLLSAALCMSASASDFDAAAEDLSAIGMFRGTANGFELDRVPTRSEAAIMLVRLYGAEEDAKAAYASGEISPSLHGCEHLYLSLCGVALHKRHRQRHHRHHFRLRQSVQRQDVLRLFAARPGLSGRHGLPVCRHAGLRPEQGLL